MIRPVKLWSAGELNNPRTILRAPGCTASIPIPRHQRQRPGNLSKPPIVIYRTYP